MRIKKITFIRRLNIFILIIYSFYLSGCTGDDNNNSNIPIHPGNVSTWILHSLEDISSYKSTNISDKTSLQIVKNEYEHFQLVFQVNQDDVFSVTHSKNITGLQFDCRTIASFEGHEDILVPCNGIINTFEKTSKLWITYHATSQTVAGEYQDTITFIGHTQQFRIEVTVEVVNLSLPETPSIASLFGIYPNNLMPADTTIAEWEHKYKEMSDLLLDYRISPFSNITGTTSPYAWNDPRTITYLSDKRLSRIGLPILSKEEDLKNMLDIIRQNGLMNKSYFYAADEPTTLEAYARIRANADLIHKIAPDGKIMVTLYTGPDNPPGPDVNDLLIAIDDLKETVQIFCIDDWTLQNNEEYTKKCREKIQPYGEWWTYNCMGMIPGLANNSSPVENRLMLWKSWKEQATGFLFWSVNAFASTDPLASNTNLPSGDGVLVYPGKPFGSVTPVVSIRLERWRDGAEDYELLVMTEKKKGRNTAETLLEKVYLNPTQFVSNPLNISSFKTHMIQEILE